MKVYRWRPDSVGSVRKMGTHQHLPHVVALRVT